VFKELSTNETRCVERIICYQLKKITLTCENILKSVGDLDKFREELERSQATLGKSQLQQEKLQNSLDKAQNEVDHLQEKLDKSLAEIRRVSFNLFIITNLTFDTCLY
jgi:peptidoglycan hydrolase CwlO-like protein